MSSKDLSHQTIYKVNNPQTIKIGIIVSQWNHNITDNLLKGAKDTLILNDISIHHIDIFYVPGSFELIFAANQLAKLQKYDAIITIGCIIKGETEHFTFISDAISQGIKDINITYDTPTIFCVLTDNNEQQSIARSGGNLGNKGVEAAISALKMIDFNKKINPN